MGFFASLIAQIGADTTNFDKGVKKCELMAEKFGKNVAHHIAGIGAGYLTIDYAVGLLSESMERAGKVKELSERLGIDTELLQQMQFAAKQTGTELDFFAKSIQRLNMARSEALSDPNGEKANIFSRYGIGLKELQSMSGEEIFFKIGDAVKETANPQNELVYATELLGKTAAQVFPAMRDGLRELAVEAKKTGEVMEKDVVNKLHDAEHRYEQLKRKAGNLFARGVVGGWDIISGVFEGAARGMAGASPMAPQNYADMATKKSDEENKKEPQKKKEDFTSTKEEKSKTMTPTEWAYKAPSGDKLREIGGFTGAAQNAQLAYLEKIRDATERSANANEKTATIVESESGPIP